MRKLLTNGTVINVFCGDTERTDVLIEDDRVVGVGNYDAGDADEVEDVYGSYVCPGFIDGHIHIESTMLRPVEFARAALPHGTCAVVADPHEIANVCGTDGIRYMLAASEGLPLRVFVMLPSCVPSSPFDESGAALAADDLRPLYDHPRVLGLAEMMDYPGVLARDPSVLRKIDDALSLGLKVDGHAPYLSGHDLDAYLACGIGTDHECSTAAEAIERVRKGQWLMIRQGTAARNLEALLPLFDEPYASRCLLVTDDRHAADLIGDGHIDAIIRRAVALGKSPIRGIQMATLQAAQCFGLKLVGAIAPGYRADLLVLDNLDSVAVRDVYCAGRRVVERGMVLPFEVPTVPDQLSATVCDTMHVGQLRESDFCLHNALDRADIAMVGDRSDKGAVPGKPGSRYCRVIRMFAGQLVTQEWVTDVDLELNDGVDTNRDIIKLAVVERHHATGHVGLGYLSGLGLARGAIASTVSHDSHNLIVAGVNGRDMALAANRARQIGGGLVAVCAGEVLAEVPLVVGGLMSRGSAEQVAAQNEALRDAARELGCPEEGDPFMALAFVSLPVIPDLKMSTLGLVDVTEQRYVSVVCSHN